MLLLQAPVFQDPSHHHCLNIQSLPHPDHQSLTHGTLNLHRPQHRKSHLVHFFGITIHLKRIRIFSEKKKKGEYTQSTSEKSPPENDTAGRHLQKSTQAELKDSFFFVLGEFN